MFSTGVGSFDNLVASEIKCLPGEVKKIEARGWHTTTQRDDTSLRELGMNEFYPKHFELLTNGVAERHAAP